MPLYSILLIGSWVLVAGIIAYTGNWVGRRLGKQRLSLFGLRPRYTATIFTIIAGMLIAGLTIFALSRLSTKVQIALTRVDFLIREQASLKSENARMRKEKSNLVHSLQISRALKAKSDLELKKAEAAATAARLRSSKLSQEIDVKTKELNQATLQLTVTKQELGRMQSDLTRSRTELARVDRELAKANVQLTKATRQALLVGKENIQLYTTKLLLENRKVIYRPNDEVTRGIIHANQNVKLIQAELRELLASGGIEARKHGAAVGVAGPAVTIPERVLGGKRYQQEDVIAALARRIANEKTDMVTRVVALINSVQGQQVMVDFELKPNKIIYKRGDEIASKLLDSNQSEADLLKQLVTSLKTQVRADALQRGIIPKANLEDGSDYESIGEVSYDDLLKAVQRIKKEGRLTQVRFRAAEDTWAEGPLKIDFQIVEEHSVN